MYITRDFKTQDG